MATHRAQKLNPERYGARVIPVLGGRLVLHCNTEADAIPWVRLLTGAGVTLARTPNGGYLFTFDGRPDLTEPDPARADGNRRCDQVRNFCNGDCKERQAGLK